MNDVHCEGWWEQRGYGRQPMRNLRLTIAGTQISGTGMDIVGPFTVTGLLDKERVMIKKRYVGRHAVDYFGVYDGEGTLSGEWRMGFGGGRWMIKIVSLVADADAVPVAIAEWKPV